MPYPLMYYMDFCAAFIPGKRWLYVLDVEYWCSRRVCVSVVGKYVYAVHLCDSLCDVQAPALLKVVSPGVSLNRRPYYG